MCSEGSPWPRARGDNNEPSHLACSPLNPIHSKTRCWRHVLKTPHNRRSQHRVRSSPKTDLPVGLMIRWHTLRCNGASAIALWGHEERGFGTDGNQPRNTTVVANICHEIGLYQKQSSCFFQAVSAQSTIQRNIFYNGPRAMVHTMRSICS